MPSTDYLDNLILEWAFDASDFPAALASAYVTLYTVLPTKSSAGTEVSGGGFARVATAPTDWTIFGSPRQVQNVNVIEFPTVVSAWGTVLGWGVMDAAGGGNALWYAATNQIAPLPGDPVVLNAGQLVIVGTS